MESRDMARHGATWLALTFDASKQGWSATDFHNALD